jgi:ABC-type antimicrobial peptide transport system permease subunit
VISESFARLIAPGGDPLGHHVTESSGPRGQGLPVDEVVGVVPDVIARVTNLHPLVMYEAMAQREDEPDRSLAVRSTGDPAAAVRDTVAAIKILDRTVTPTPIHTINEQIALQMVPQQFGTFVLGILGAIATLLTLLGAYVLAESMATVRRREMGIRAALGATGAQLGAIVLGDTAKLVGLGLIVGLGLAWLGANTIRALLFQTAPLDPVTLAGVAATIVIMAFLVSLRPALRTARVDLARALRED